MLLLLALLVSLLAASYAASSGEARDGGPVVDPRLEHEIAAVGDATPIRAVLTYDGRPSVAQVRAVRDAGVAVHTFEVLPMLGVEGTEAQIRRLLRLDGVDSVFLDRRLDYLLHESRPLIGANRVENGMGITGRGVGVAVIDSGVDGLNPDVRYPGRLVQNVKITGAPGPSDGRGLGISVLENQKNTDTSSGHGTHVAGTVGGNGAASNGYYTGVAPGSDLVGIGAGDALFILHALEGFDYALAHQREYDIRVISNSWGTEGRFRPKDPVNVASREAHDRGITVVFAAGNAGPERDTLNPYSVAPWVVGVAAGKKDGNKLAGFSSRGVPGSDLYHPDVTAPGVNIVSARASTGSTINGLAAADDATYIPKRYLPRYTTSSGTSMATPHVSGTVALMEQANPALGPEEMERILKGTATSMPGYGRFEAGSGYLNAFDAVTRAKTLR